MLPLVRSCQIYRCYSGWARVSLYRSDLAVSFYDYRLQPYPLSSLRGLLFQLQLWRLEDCGRPCQSTMIAYRLLDVMVCWSLFGQKGDCFFEVALMDLTVQL